MATANVPTRLDAATSLLLAALQVFVITEAVLAQTAASGVDNNLITAKLSVDHLNNSHSSSSANYLWLHCDYHLIASNYLEHTNHTLALSTGSDIRYKCTLLIDSTDCSIYHRTHHAAVTELIPVNCRDLQIVLQVPVRIRANPDLSRTVQENALQVHCDNPNHDKYVVWLNISHFSPQHQGEYTFLFQTSPQERTLFEHRVTLLTLPANRQANKSTKSEFSQSWLTLGFISTFLALIFFAIYLLAFRRIHRARRLIIGNANMGPSKN